MAARKGKATASKAAADGHAQDDELVALKTTPNLREATSTDNSNFFEKDYLVYLPEGDELTDELKDRQINDVRQSAMQRGLRPSGDVSLEEQHRDGNSEHLIYKVPVEKAAPPGVNPEPVEHAHVSEADQAEAEKE